MEPPGASLPQEGLVVFGEASCDGPLNPPPGTETIFAFRISDGPRVWSYRPHKSDHGCDFDFRATPNIAPTRSGMPTFLGDGSKDGHLLFAEPSHREARVEDPRRVRGERLRTESFVNTVRCDVGGRRRSYRRRSLRDALLGQLDEHPGRRRL